MASRQQEQQHNNNNAASQESHNHGSLCLSLMLSHPACLAAAGCDAKCVAAAMATCREARDAARAAHDVQRRAMEARVHNHGTIRSLQDPSFPQWGPSEGIFVGGRDPTHFLEACEMVALMSVDAKKGRVLFTVTLGCHNACDPGCFCTDSNSFAVRALVRHLGMWQWVPVLTVYNLFGPMDGEAIAVASTSVERALNDALDLDDDGQLGFVVRTLIETSSNVRHHGGKNPWSYMKAVYAWNMYRVQMPRDQRHDRPGGWTVNETVNDDPPPPRPPPPPPRGWSGIYPKRSRSLDALDDDAARSFPRGWASSTAEHMLEYMNYLADLPEPDEGDVDIEMWTPTECKITTFVDRVTPSPNKPTSFCHSLGNENTSPPLSGWMTDHHWTSPRHMVLGVERLFIGDGPLANANGNEEPDARIFTTADFEELIAGWNREPPAEFETFELLKTWRDEIIQTRTVCAWAMVSRLEAHRGLVDGEDVYNGIDNFVWQARWNEIV
ncbi:hypothetical protein PPROV_000162800 [Pycnococcus provasolii]|uniref:Uncharacterized protein n=1 Tax=Pycnococcus provasolii TaxID=41880 RepID=A0A830H910_9CHLO|nr:hypothetical protein PPROV_000162800 [Pycnococcus provasolii]